MPIDKNSKGETLVKIYFAPDTRAVRIVWLCEELGLPYELEFFKLGDASMRSPAYLSIHPLGRVPTLVDDEVTIFESGAIVQYVLAKYGKGRLVPDVGSLEFPAYLQWFHFAEGMIMPPINIIVVETVLLPPERRNQVNVDRATKLLSRMLSSVDARVSGREFLAGNFSAADIMLGQACMAAAKAGADLSGQPNLSAYLNRLRGRPAFKKANATGRPRGGDVPGQT
jgi:glutathione S-transferase